MFYDHALMFHKNALMNAKNEGKIVSRKGTDAVDALANVGNTPVAADFPPVNGDDALVIGKNIPAIANNKGGIVNRKGARRC